MLGQKGLKAQVAEKATAFGSRAMTALRYGAVMASLTLPALASESGGGSSSGMSSITNAATTVETFTGTAFSLITGNPLLCAYAASGLVGVGIYTFRKLKKASR